MTIDRAIKREQAKAEEYRAMSSEGNAEIAEIYIRCSKYHEQLAEWLEELKDYRDKNKMVVRVDCENMDSIKDKIEELSKYAESQYNKALNDVESEFLMCHKVHYNLQDILCMINKLKEGVSDGNG